KAIEKAAEFLLGQMRGNTIDGTRGNDIESVGLDALCVYALLQAGQAVPSERLNVRASPLKDMLTALRELPIAPVPERGRPPETYTRAIRATALALYNRPEDRQQLRADVTWLERNEKDGAYTYAAPDGFSWDNSNSQYGLLGVWSGAEA